MSPTEIGLADGRSPAERERDIGDQYCASANPRCGLQSEATTIPVERQGADTGARLVRETGDRCESRLGENAVGEGPLSLARWSAWGRLQSLPTNFHPPRLATRHRIYDAIRSLARPSVWIFKSAAPPRADGVTKADRRD